MDRAIAHLNIEHYQSLLSTKLDEAERRTIERQMAEEKAKLAQLEGDPPKSERER